jgi:pimeloyl-ACP methyl ester carboxylesterase
MILDAQPILRMEPDMLIFGHRFGRGFSDNPDDLPQDTRLFCSQILIALASSSLSWTGNASGRFSLVGYSLGGGIAASFTSFFPSLVSSLVLIAPSGLLRPNRVSLRTKILYSKSMLPEPLLIYLVRKRLRGFVAPPNSRSSGHADIQPAVPAKANVFGHEPQSDAKLPQTPSELDPARIVEFQVQHHLAFVRAYMSSMRYGPIMKEQAAWKRIGQRLSLQKQTKEDGRSAVGLDRGKVLVICANEDTSIISNELLPDATIVFEGNVEFQHFDAGHDVPISKSTEVADAIWEFWSA